MIETLTACQNPNPNLTLSHPGAFPVGLVLVLMKGRKKTKKKYRKRLCALLLLKRLEAALTAVLSDLEGIFAFKEDEEWH